MPEDVERRVLGAFRCVDAVTRIQVMDPVVVQSDQLDVRRNASQMWVVFDAPGMYELTTQFEVTSAWPAARGFEVSVRSISRRYLPRRANVNVPRKLAAMSDPDSIMVPQDVVLYPAPTASTLPSWALLRVWVTRNNSDEGLAWAVVRVTRSSDQSLLATGMSNENGDALLAVPGLGVSASQNGGGAVSESTIDVDVAAFWEDPGQQKRPASWIPDPDVILNDLGNSKWKKFALPQPVKIGRGTLSKLKLPIAA